MASHQSSVNPTGGATNQDPSENTNEVVHGAGKSDAQPEHAKHNVAPMPEIEKGDALPGLGASGAGSDVKGSEGDSEQFAKEHGTNEYGA